MEKDFLRHTMEMTDSNLNINGIFPTPIGFTNIQRQFTEDEIDFFNKTVDEKYQNIGNWTSKNKNVLDDTSMADLKNFIEENLEIFLIKTYNPKNNVKLKITQSWINLTEQGQFHHKHAHSNSFLSGTMYLMANKETDKIYFHNEVYHRLYLEAKEFNWFNSDQWWYAVGPGDLIIFPSSVFHSVEELKSDRRISLSFNAFLKGDIGGTEGLNALNL